MLEHNSLSSSCSDQGPHEYTDTNTNTNTSTDTDRYTNSKEGRGMPCMGIMVGQFAVVKLISTGASSHEGAVPNNGL